VDAADSFRLRRVLRFALAARVLLQVKLVQRAMVRSLDCSHVAAEIIKLALSALEADDRVGAA
jgi:post-segregation antitoxin (ccd killing protein)